MLARRAAKRLPKTTPSKLARKSLRNQRQAVERYLGFLKRRHPEILAKPFAERFERWLLDRSVKDFGPTTETYGQPRRKRVITH